MITAATEKRYTPEELLTMRDGKLYELVDGRLVDWKSRAVRGAAADTFAGKDTSGIVRSTTPTRCWVGRCCA